MTRSRQRNGTSCVLVVRIASRYKKIEAKHKTKMPPGRSLKNMTIRKEDEKKRRKLKDSGM